ncbi:MAG: DUF1499 domain-containing protein [Mariprofundaceae bacterium]|nr:DUF1499 domain-containing protein [Mariprofundaceae bacterium]
MSAEEKLKPCPDSPNCVSTLAKDSPMQALLFIGDTKEAKKKLLGILKTMPRYQMLKDDGRYIHVTFTSKWFDFVDDVAFYFEDKSIHMRSASRTGRYDFGVNLKRLEHIQSLWLLPEKASK